MPANSQKKYIVCLSQQERSLVMDIISKGSAPARKLQHAHVLLKTDNSLLGEHWTDEAIARTFHLGVSTVQRIRILYVEGGLMAALNRATPSRTRPPKLSGEEEAQLVRLACSQPPAGQARWTLRLLASKLVELEYVEQISYESVRRVLKKTNLSPGRRSSGVSPQKLMVNS